MIVEPTPTNPPSPGRSALRMAGLVLPLALLAGIVAAGVLGQPGATGPPIAESSGSPAGTSPTARVSPGPSGSTSPAGIADAPNFPTTVEKMRVGTVESTLATWLSGDGSRIVAVSGYLRVNGPGDGCDIAPGIPGASCARAAVLAELPGTGSGTGAIGSGGFGPHIHAVVPPGVVVPGDVGNQPVDGSTFSPVVIIGRFGATNAGCAGDMAGCVHPFVIEQVAWAGGAPVKLAAGIEKGLSVRRSEPMVARQRATASAALGPTTALLRVLLLRPSALAAVDPDAAAAISTRRIAGAIWYVRALDVHLDPIPGPFNGIRHPTIRWAVIDRRTGARLAGGEVPAAFETVPASG
jgi:hypothetical protein